MLGGLTAAEILAEKPLASKTEEEEEMENTDGYFASYGELLI